MEEEKGLGIPTILSLLGAFLGFALVLAFLLLY